MTHKAKSSLQKLLPTHCKVILTMKSKPSVLTDHGDQIGVGLGNSLMIGRPRSANGGEF
jgi:hypothetical protein